MGINKTIWTDIKTTIEALTPTFRPEAKYQHLPGGVDFDSVAARRDRHFKIIYQSGAEYPIEMCQRALYVRKSLFVQVAYGVPNGHENDTWLADIQDDADEIIRALQMSNTQFNVQDTTGDLIRRVHDGTLEIELSGDSDRQAILTLGFEIQYSRP